MLMNANLINLKNMDTFDITCYGKTTTYNESERGDMIREFCVAMASCEGSERDRYVNIYLDLVAGLKDCRDE